MHRPSTPVAGSSSHRSGKFGRRLHSASGTGTPCLRKHLSTANFHDPGDERVRFRTLVVADSIWRVLAKAQLVRFTS
jgi:hypothetical protein